MSFKDISLLNRPSFSAFSNVALSSSSLCLSYILVRDSQSTSMAPVGQICSQYQQGMQTSILNIGGDMPKSMASTGQFSTQRLHPIHFSKTTLIDLLASSRALRNSAGASSRL